jgi:fucose permease
MPFSIFRLRTLRGANVIGLLVGMSLFSMFFFISLYLQQVLHYSALKAGIAYLPLALAIILAAGAASQLVERFGLKFTLIAGLALVVVGLVWFSHVSAPHGTYVADVLGPSLLAGAGLGLLFVPMTIGAMTGTQPREAGLASGLINTSQQVGGALGVAILASIANSRTRDVLHAGTHDVAVALTKGFQEAFLVGAGFAAAGVVLAVLLIPRVGREQGASEPAAGIPEPAGPGGSGRPEQTAFDAASG